jgi:Dynein heavy chain, N-terminal region 1
VIKGAKEARWNNKYMKVIEKPVTQIERAEQLKDIQFVIISLLKSLKNIYENSNFYKEARIVSFVDRLLECIMSKVKSKIGLTVGINKGKNEYEEY